MSERCPRLLLESVLHLWVPPQGLDFRGLTVFPVYGGLVWQGHHRPSVRYTPLRQAIERHTAVVSEMPSAHVPELLIQNSGSELLMGLDGDEFVGGRQNRVLNATVLLAKGQTAVPVSCVEQRRWAQTGAASFSGGERLPYHLRASSHGHVSQNLRSGHGGHASDQRAVWREIEDGHSRHGSSSSTAAMHAIYQAQKEVLEAYQTAIPYPKNALGMVVSLGGKLSGLDLFDQAATAEHYWPRLVRACAAEALACPHRACSDNPRELLQAAAACQTELFKSPGLGHDLRLQSPDYHGSALIYEDVIVHLSLFRKGEK